MSKSPKLMHTCTEL